jgi:very-short-patch-repair endonuclease
MNDGLRRRRAPPDPAALERVAEARREDPTRAERALEAILNGLAGGALAGEFRREWVCGEWILDFYFPGVRLGIEVDGGYHRSTRQLSRDLAKTAGLEAAGVTLVRFSNEEVFGDRARLVAKLREAWRAAQAGSRM